MKPSVVLLLLKSILGRDCYRVMTESVGKTGMDCAERPCALRRVPLTDDAGIDRDEVSRNAGPLSAGFCRPAGNGRTS